MLQTKNFMKFLQHYSHYVCGTLNSSHTFTLTSCGARVSLQTHLVCRPIEFSKRRLNRGLLVLFHIYSCLRTSCTKVCVCSARNFYFVSICQTVGSQDCFRTDRKCVGRDVQLYSLTHRVTRQPLSITGSAARTRSSRLRPPNWSISSGTLASSTSSFF